MIDRMQFTYGAAGTVVSATGFALSVTQLQGILSLVATALGLIITIVTSIIIPIAKKIKRAKEDGKITIEEAEEIINELRKEIEQLNRSNKQ